MSTQQPAVSSDVVRELGPLDALTIAKILELRPTVDTLVEAGVYLSEGEPEGGRRAPSPVVDRIVDLVRDELAREEAEADEPPDLSFA